MLNPVLLACWRSLAKTETLEEQADAGRGDRRETNPSQYVRPCALRDYGRVGSLLGEKLLASDIPLVVIETSRTRVDELRDAVPPCIRQSAADEEIMQLAHRDRENG